jgi:hypothetical protein
LAGTVVPRHETKDVPKGPSFGLLRSYGMCTEKRAIAAATNILLATHSCWPARRRIVHPQERSGQIVYIAPVQRTDNVAKGTHFSPFLAVCAVVQLILYAHDRNLPGGRPFVADAF